MFKITHVCVQCPLVVRTPINEFKYRFWQISPSQASQVGHRYSACKRHVNSLSRVRCVPQRMRPGCRCQPASGRRTALYTLLLPSRRLRRTLACSFSPGSVGLKKKYRNTTAPTVTARIARYWLSGNPPPNAMSGDLNTHSNGLGCGPKDASTVFCIKIESPSMLVITSRNDRLRSGY